MAAVALGQGWLMVLAAGEGGDPRWTLPRVPQPSPAGEPRAGHVCLLIPLCYGDLMV